MGRRAPIPLASLGIFACLLALWIGFAVALHPEARACDLLNLYTGAKLTLRGQGEQMYLPDVQLAAERESYPTPVLRPFVRPPFYGLLLGPLSLVPYGTASWLMVAGMFLIASSASLWLGTIHKDAIVLPSLFMPLWVGIALGQDCAVYFLVSLAAYMLSERGQPFTSGAVLAILLAKFHLVVLLPVMLIVQRRWRMLWGFTSAGFALAVVSVAISGVSGILQYVRFVTDGSNALIHNTPERMVNLWALLLKLGIANPWTAAAGTTVLAAAALTVFRRHHDWRAFAACFAGSAVIAPHVYSYDLAASIPFVCMAALWGTRRALRVTATAIFVPVQYVLATTGGGWEAIPPAIIAAFVLVLAWEPEHQARANREQNTEAVAV